MTWRSEAACAGMDPALFFDDHPKRSHKTTRTLTAIDICSACPVRAACLQDALDHDDHGIRGGLTTYERRRLYGRARLMACAVCGTQFRASHPRRVLCGDNSCRHTYQARWDLMERISE